MKGDPVSASDLIARRAEIEAPLDPDRYRTLRRLATSDHHRLVVSLGGGSFPALCGNAMLLSIVEELGLRNHVREIWGTSAGAVIAASWASGVAVSEMVPLGKRFARRETLDVPRLRIAWSLIRRPFGGRLPDGLVRGRRIRASLASMIRVERIEDCQIPFRCVAATDDGTARRHVFRRGPIVPAVYASMTVPGVMSPFEVSEDGPGFLDGGLVEKTPLLSPIADHRRMGGGAKLLLLGTAFGSEKERPPPRGFVRRFLHAIDALEHRLWSYQVAEAHGMEDVVLLLPRSGIDDPRLFDFERVETNLLQARLGYRESLDDAHVAAALGSA